MGRILKEKRKHLGGKKPRKIQNQGNKKPLGEIFSTSTLREDVDKPGRPREGRNRKPTLFREEPIRMAKTDKPRDECCRGWKMVRYPRKDQTHNKERNGDILTKIPKETNPGIGKEIDKWEIVVIYYYNFDKCNGFVIGLTSY